MAYVIAEIGFNHGGDVELAIKMIKAAADSGVDAVKFQSFFASDLYLPKHELYPIFKAGELGEAEHVKLKKAADDYGVGFMSTPFGPHWVEVLEKLGPVGYKIASMDINNPVLLKAIAGKGRKVYFSTGASDIAEAKQAIQRLKEWGAEDVCAMHCVSNYPTPPEEAMLYMLPVMKKELDAQIGFSDHTLGVAIPIAAVALGAEVVEKHFTIDKSLPGPDHSISADPEEMRTLVDSLKAVTCAIVGRPGAAGKRPDAAKKAVMRRGIYAARDIKKGEIIDIESLKLVRPEITPLDELGKILGKPSKQSYNCDEPMV